MKPANDTGIPNREVIPFIHFGTRFLRGEQYTAMNQKKTSTPINQSEPFRLKERIDKNENEEIEKRKGFGKKSCFFQP